MNRRSQHSVHVHSHCKSQSALGRPAGPLKASPSFPGHSLLTTVLGTHKTLGRLVDEGLLERVGNRHAPTEDFFALPLVGPARGRASARRWGGQAPKALCVESFLVDHQTRPFVRGSPPAAFIAPTTRMRLMTKFMPFRIKWDRTAPWLGV